MWVTKLCYQYDINQLCWKIGGSFGKRSPRRGDRGHFCSPPSWGQAPSLYGRRGMVVSSEHPYSSPFQATAGDRDQNGSVLPQASPRLGSAKAAAAGKTAAVSLSSKGIYSVSGLLIYHPLVNTFETSGIRRYLRHFFGLVFCRFFSRTLFSILHLPPTSGLNPSCESVLCLFPLLSPLKWTFPTCILPTLRRASGSPWWN